MTHHTIRGLDTRDLALLATACADRANYLAHLTTSPASDNRTTDPANSNHDRHQAAIDADRLRYIAHSLLGQS